MSDGCRMILFWLFSLLCSLQKEVMLTIQVDYGCEVSFEKLRLFLVGVAQKCR